MPTTHAARVEWLYEQWQHIDDWIGEVHPHIFGNEADSGERQSERWEKLKAEERKAKGAESALDERCKHGVVELAPP